MSRETTLDTLEPQPAKKKRSELGVPLYLPAGVVIPPFYEQEPDASVISTALQLGADAVCHLRSQAEQVRLQELLDTKASELTQRSATLEDELSAVRDKVNEEVNRLVTEQTRALQTTLQVRDEEVSELKSACQKQREAIATNLGNLEKQLEDMRNLNANLQFVRGDERRVACGAVHSTLEVHEKRVADLRENIQSLIGDGEEREQVADKQTTSSVEGKNQQTERGKQSAYITTKYAVSKLMLRELVVQAFEKTNGFELQQTSENHVTARIFELQTRWYRRDQTSVKQDKVNQIKSQLEVHPEVDVAFLVALQAGIAEHTEHLFDVELLKTGQALVYVNQLTSDDNPAQTLQMFARPMLSALLRIKQVRAVSGANAARRLKLSASRWLETVTTHVTELAAERAELQNDILKSEEQFDARRKRIDKRAEALQELQQGMEPSCAMPTSS